MPDKSALVEFIKTQALELGFLDCSISKPTISTDAQIKFNQWIEHKFHGSMHYLDNNREIRFNPAKIHDGTLSIICVKIPYLNQDISVHQSRLENPDLAYISSYALGRDYHKVVKSLLNQLAKRINTYLDNIHLQHTYRVFTDSAPIMEVELASNSGLGWRGKNTLLIDSKQGSMYFLGELFTNLDLPADKPIQNHCGSCSKCLQICPTNAFVDPYTLDARRCISYLTIENKGAIPTELRKLIGNRIYGCDDCQLYCPWNKFSQLTTLKDFNTRNHLDNSSLIELLNWTEREFQERLQGSPIYRIGYLSWVRNLAVGIGNSPYSLQNISALENQLKTIDDVMVKEHLNWAILEQQSKA